jgi:hypothetical protein
MKLPESAIQDVERRVLAEQRRKLNAIGDPLECLDVSNSQLKGSSVSSMPDTGLPGTMERIDYYLNVRNGCPLPADNVIYEVSQTTTCPDPSVPKESTRSYVYEADPFLVGIGENSGQLGPRYTYAGCEALANDVPIAVLMPSEVKVSVQATGEIPGTAPGTVNLVHSQKKDIKVI